MNKTPYKDWPEAKKERAREACRKWAKKNNRQEYHRNYEKGRCADRTEYKMFISARKRASENNLPFSIIEGDIKIPKNCPICKTEMKVSLGKRGGSRTSPTLDRVICDEGYVPSNIVVICKNCNSLKGHATSQELRQIANYIDEFLKTSRPLS